MIYILKLNVTGPEFLIMISIKAPNFPSETLSETFLNSVTNSSYNNFASSGFAAL